MRKAMILAASLGVLAGCGGPGWQGNWAGPAAASVKCSDGSNAGTSVQSHFGLTRNGNEVSYTADCGALVLATIDGNTAAVHQTTCPTVTPSDGGPSLSVEVTGGVLTLSGDSLAVNLTEHEVFSGSVSATCEATLVGTLARQ